MEGRKATRPGSHSEKGLKDKWTLMCLEEARQRLAGQLDPSGTPPHARGAYSGARVGCELGVAELRRRPEGISGPITGDMEKHTSRHLGLWPASPGLEVRLPAL